MITATCKNDACEWHQVERYVLQSPSRVECGGCGNACDITDERDDPPQEIEE